MTPRELQTSISELWETDCGAQRIVAACRSQTNTRPNRFPWRHVTWFECLPIESIAHLDNDKNGQRARLGLCVAEYLAVDAWKHSWLGRTLHVMSLTTRARKKSKWIEMNII